MDIASTDLCSSYPASIMCLPLGKEPTADSLWIFYIGLNGHLMDRKT